MTTAIIYDRVVKWGGAERVLFELHEMFPDAPLYTSVYDKTKATWASVFDVRVSFLQKFPAVVHNHELFAWVMPFAFESFSFDEYDLVISVTSAEAKGIITKPHTKHICYCLTPTRYLWSHYDEYFSNPFVKTISSPIVSHMRRWDTVAATRPDMMVAISTAVKDRIKTYYGRESAIIYPPVGMRNSKSLSAQVDEIRNPCLVGRQAKFEIRNNLIEKGFFLVVSRLVTYKKVDVVIDAFNITGLPLVVVGTGRDEAYLRQKAGNNIQFTSSLTDEELSWYYQHAEAVVCAQEEDFGLVSVEAQAHGTPVIAYRAGGALDTIVDGKTGLFFDKQTPETLNRMIQSYSKASFDTRVMKQHAEKFSSGRFRKEIMMCVHNVLHTR